jgi:site-specific recombinase XerD
MSVGDPTDLAPATARDRFLDRRSTSTADATIRSYRVRLDRFVQFCHEHGLERVGDLSPWAIDLYLDELGSEDLAPTTHKGHVVALNQLVQYLVGIGAVDEALERAIEVPRVDPEDEMNDKALDPSDAATLLKSYRTSTAWFGTPRHAVLEVAWCTGARVGGLRALDLDDVDRGGRALSFRHRSGTDTALKNKIDGERDVGLPEAVCDVLETYIDRERPEKRDDHGRAPLFATNQGRATIGTLRSWCYLATQPCVAVRCPHDRRRARCNYRERNHASKCPSSRSPHQVRTGSITWQLNTGVPLEIVSERVNASASIIAKHYDVATAREELEERRRPYVERFDVAAEVSDK